MMRKKAKLTGDAEPVLAYYNDIQALARTDLASVQVLYHQAEALTDAQEKGALYDQLIAKYKGSKNPKVAWWVAHAVQRKSWLLDRSDKAGKAALFKVIADNPVHRTDRLGLLNLRTAYKAFIEAADSVEEKIRLHDEYATAENLSKDDRAQAALEKCALPGDPVERMRLYELFIAEHRHETSSRILEYCIDAYLALADLRGGRQEKLRLYDEALATLDGKHELIGIDFSLGAEKVIRKKADLLGDPGSIETYFRGRMAATDNEYYKLRWLSCVSESCWHTANEYAIFVLAELFDTFSAPRTTAAKRWVLIPAERLASTGRHAERIERLISSYQDENDPFIRGSVAGVMLALANNLQSGAEADKLYARLIATYEDDVDHQAVKAVEEARKRLADPKRNLFRSQ